MIDGFIESFIKDKKIVHCRECMFAEKHYYPHIKVTTYSCGHLANDVPMRQDGYCYFGMTEGQFERLVRNIRKTTTGGHYR